MRAVLDPNVLIAALLSPAGSPAHVIRAWLEGAYQLVASPLLLSELERALTYPKLRARVTETEAAELLELLRASGEVLRIRRATRRSGRPTPETTTASRWPPPPAPSWSYRRVASAAPSPSPWRSRITHLRGVVDPAKVAHLNGVLGTWPGMSAHRNA